MIVDSIYPECALGLAATLTAPPVIYFNSMTNFLNNIASTGSPAPWSISPVFSLSLTNRMHFPQRLANAGAHLLVEGLRLVTGFRFHRIIQNNLGMNISHPRELAKTVSFVLQNGHVTVSHPHPYSPNVAEVGGLHCRPARRLPEV